MQILDSFLFIIFVLFVCKQNCLHNRNVQTPNRAYILHRYFFMGKVQALRMHTHNCTQRTYTCTQTICDRKKNQIANNTIRHICNSDRMESQRRFLKYVMNYRCDSDVYYYQLFDMNNKFWINPHKLRIRCWLIAGKLLLSPANENTNLIKCHHKQD